jgi:hypothetical protein
MSKVYCNIGDGREVMKPGTQIAYVPTHVNSDIRHPDVEFGFVTSYRPAGEVLANPHYFCRYWRKGHLGELRTTSCSELTSAYLLVECESVPQGVVDACLKGLMS